MTFTSQPPPMASIDPHVGAAAMPRLSVRHFLYWTFGAAICLTIMYGGSPPKPRNLLGVMLVASTATYSISAGGSIAFLATLLATWFRSGRMSGLDPGARYAAILGAAMTVAMAAKLVEQFAGQVMKLDSDREIQIWLFTDLTCGCFVALIQLLGVLVIGGVAWRIALACSLMLSILSIKDSLQIVGSLPADAAFGFLFSAAVDWAFHLLHYAPIGAVSLAVVGDCLKGTLRRWPHYFGVLLCVLMTVEFALVQFVLFAL